MERRELLKRIAFLTGCAFVGSELLLQGCSNPSAGNDNGFTEKELALLNEMAETILPKTTSPGAKDAAVGSFITVMVNDCYTKQDQQIFHDGLKTFSVWCKEKHQKDFLALNAEQRTQLLKILDEEAKEHGNLKKDNEPAHYFTMIKQMTLFGFFTSETGATQALRHIAIPGKYDGALTYKKGDRAWAEQ